jgi:hypothetical protein
VGYQFDQTYPISPEEHLNAHARAARIDAMSGSVPVAEDPARSTTVNVIRLSEESTSPQVAENETSPEVVQMS